ncbi:MAG TPA: YolD-like family protein [Bacillota bacterium]
MLLEHVEVLKQIFAEEERKEKPIIDEQQLVEINAKLTCALKDQRVVEITYYDHVLFCGKKATGEMLTIDTLRGLIRLGDEGICDIAFESVLDVTIL